jgi:hypothetical protein
VFAAAVRGRFLLHPAADLVNGGEAEPVLLRWSGGSWLTTLDG